MSAIPMDDSIWNLLNSETTGAGSTSNSQFPGFSSQAPMTPEQQAFFESQQAAFDIAKDAKLIEIDDQLLVLIKRQVEIELMLEEKFRYLCEEVYNFIKEIEDVVKEVERLSCKDVAKKTVRLFRRGQKRELYKMTRLQMMVNESHLNIREKHTFVSKMNLGTLD
uniref:Uncharacterized protein n=1 Tax=Tanacetum cinerariifolium TaxID=118510 RepID=A0A699I203_TANCI|nr:hypothetical protein [Tanacetum cinerariifolium]